MITRQSVRRSTAEVTADVSWPATWPGWDGLTRTARNQIRDLMDEITDLVDQELRP